MSATRRSDRRDPRELPRGNVPTRVVAYALRTPAGAVPFHCGCGGTATRLVLDGDTRFVCGAPRCQ